MCSALRILLTMLLVLVSGQSSAGIAAEGEMPPDDALSTDEQKLLRRWIEDGAPGLSKTASGKTGHWAFQRLAPHNPPQPTDAGRGRTPVDRFVLSKLDLRGLSLNPQADRSTLIRRVSYDLTGLPPAPDEITRFLADQADDAYQRMVDRYLSSPRYGERWGNHWLDVAGYADSNGYFSADTDRPLAYRYRDYVIRSFNADKPFDQFVREQLAGDELAETIGYRPGGTITPRFIELLEATHFLRNAQDGTDSSDGNPDEVRTDKYKALEGTLQIIGSSLLGLKLQCARCHDHKFEPIRQREYYQLQAVLFPAFNVDNWIVPQKRFVIAASAKRIAEWEADSAKLDDEVALLQTRFAEWFRKNREPGLVAFEDRFDKSDRPDATADPDANTKWSNSVPGDASPAGTPAVQIGSATAPGAVVEKAALRIIESGAAGDRGISTKRKFDWTPDAKNAWIQATFDLVANSVDGSPPAARIGYFIALADFNDRGEGGGNILLDGNPAGGAAVDLDYPGSDSKSAGSIGQQGYQSGHNYGVRVTNEGQDRFRLDHLVDGAVEGKSVTIAASDLPDGGFGFEYCCGRSFIVDNVVVETSDPSLDPSDRLMFAKKLAAKRKKQSDGLKALAAQRTDKPGKIAWVTDASSESLDVYLLDRGDYKVRLEKVQPAGLTILSDPDNPSELRPTDSKVIRTTGRRLAFARWLTQPGSKSAAVLARVTVNRIWQRHFGRGIVSTSDNLGYSGSPPSHPKLLDWLAARFVESSWSVKHMHRLILASAAYRQSSVPNQAGREIDPDNRLLWRHALRRLDAESIRDGMLAISGELDRRMGGPYVPTKRLSPSEVTVDENSPGARRRSVYLQRRRTQIPNFLKVFDAPSVVFNCTLRDSTTVPLQSLALMNSDFSRRRAAALAARLRRDAGAGRDAKITRAFLLVLGRDATREERVVSRTFLTQQSAEYSAQVADDEQAWVDFSQMLMASNAFLYVE